MLKFWRRKVRLLMYEIACGCCERHSGYAGTNQREHLAGDGLFSSTLLPGFGSLLHDYSRNRSSL